MAIIDAVLVVFGIMFANYLVFGLGAHIFFHNVMAKKLAHRRIYDALPNAKDVRREAISSIQNIFVFGFFFLITFQIAANHSLYVLAGPTPDTLRLILAFFAVQFLHETYFYWTHRMMHKVAFLRKIHVGHHKSVYPTPLGSMSFHPGEGVIHAMFFVIIALTLPIHWTTLAVFYSFQSYINMWGHTNYEFWPKNIFRTPGLRWLNTPTHHIQHHKNGNYNFGIYYNFWDKVCGTNNPKYKSHYESVQERIHSGASA